MVLIHIFDLIGAGLREALAMVWATLWALVLGFALSGAVQAFVSRKEMGQALGRRGTLSILRATGFGAASSSCSYAASAMAKSLFAKGADFVAAMVFMFASTNLVIELGVVLAVLIGWQFTASEFLGGLLMIALLVLVARVAFPDVLVERARARLEGRAPEPAPSCAVDLGAPSGPEAGWRQRIRTREGWSDAAGYAAADLTMLRKEMAIGFLVAGFLAALVPSTVWQVVFLTGHGFWSSLENVVIGPFVAMISFVCSVGNVPLAAALWKGGISFGGVVSFVFADLITLPLLLIYRKFYGTRLTLRILAAFWLVMSAAGLATEYLFLGLHIPLPGRPTQVVGNAFTWNYTSWLDIVAVAALALVFWEAHRRTTRPSERYAIDPVCGMQVEIANAATTLAVGGEIVYFCSDRCRDRYAGEHLPTPAFTALAATAVDPVCGMSVDTSRPGATLETASGTVYFCCVSCRDRYAGEHLPTPVFTALAATAVDPVCGMSVDTARPGATLETASGTVYFCCVSCRDRYQADLAGAAPPASKSAPKS